MEPMDRFVRAEWHVDFGERGRLEAELEHSRVWVALPERLGAEVWIKSVAGAYDFRVTLSRTADGFEIAVDRGPGLGRSWPEGVPRMGINVDNSARKGAAYVRRGESDQQIWRANFVL
jgi:hypothetical protein